MVYLPKQVYVCFHVLIPKSSMSVGVSHMPKSSYAQYVYKHGHSTAKNEETAENPHPNVGWTHRISLEA